MNAEITMNDFVNEIMTKVWRVLFKTKQTRDK